MIGFIRSTAAIPHGYIRRQQPAVREILADLPEPEPEPTAHTHEPWPPTETQPLQRKGSATGERCNTGDHYECDGCGCTCHPLGGGA